MAKEKKKAGGGKGKAGKTNGTDGKRVTKRDFVVNELRAMIASGDLPRGTRVHQDELASRFETSITPVREALRQLEAEGLLVGEPHRGVRVSEANPREQLGIYIARRRLEPFAVELATENMSRKDLTRADRIIEAEQEAGEAGDAAGVRNANRDFHFFLYDRSEVPSLVKFIEGPWAAFPWDTLDVLDSSGSQSVKDHAAIVNFMKAGDARQAGESMERHLGRSFRDLIKHLTGSAPEEDPFDFLKDR